MEQSTESPPLPALPEKLQNFRARRYKGDNLYSAMEDFAERDQEIIRRIYGLLSEVLALVDPARSREDDAFKEFAKGLDVEGFTSGAQAFGIETHQSNPSEAIGKTIHDIRGGGLSALLGNLMLASFAPDDAGVQNSLFFLSRDHLKIMRNALTGLDDERRNADLLPKLHPISLVVEKWRGIRFTAPGVPEARVDIDCEFSGNVAECCVEFGALDRIIYNLLNNASRHSADGYVRFRIAPVPRTGAADDLRFMVSNSVTADDRQKLEELRGRSADLRNLFKPGVSSTGSGLGMTIVIDFVCNAYGIESREAALQERYLGATVDGGNFMSWFHWPISQAI